MDNLISALAAADEAALTELANKGIYKRACKDIDGAVPDFTVHDETAEVRIGGEVCVIKAPLTECTCSCVSRGICRHIIGAVLQLKNALAADAPAPPPEKAETPPEAPAPVTEEKKPEEAPPPPVSDILSGNDRLKISRCAESCLEVLGEIVRCGLVRIPQDLPDTIEAAAVRCHSLRMADAERQLRDIGSQLSDCLARRASFNIQFFTERLAACAKHLGSLASADFSSDTLGVFKQTYEPVRGELTILPIGQRNVDNSDYAGNIYYFLNMDENADHRFLSFSDMRPKFYNTDSRRKAQPNAAPWGMAVPLSRMMRSKMVLGNAKLNGGKLSSSQETQLLMHSAADLDCPEVWHLIYTDLRKLAVDTGGDMPQTGVESLCFVHAAKCLGCRFDKYTQKQIITIEDCHGNIVTISAKYRAETKDFIRLLEDLGYKMMSEPEKPYLILASAFIADGELTLFPIEIYDFVRIPPPEEYEVPEEYSVSEKNAYFAHIMLELLTDIKEGIPNILRCGLQSDIRNDRKAENRAFNCGLKGLAKMLSELYTAASSYRHGMHSDCTDVLMKMSDVIGYISAAQKKLEVISALDRMKPDNHERNEI